MFMKKIILLLATRTMAQSDLINAQSTLDRVTMGQHRPCLGSVLGEALFEDTLSHLLVNEKKTLGPAMFRVSTALEQIISQNRIGFD